MHHTVRRRMDMLERVVVFARNNAPELPSVPLLPALFNRVEECLEQLQSMAVRQRSGRNCFLAAAADKARIARDLREQLRDIARIARTLDPGEHPGARSHFLLPRGNGSQRLLACARAFLQHAEAIPGAFTDRGLPGDFLEALARQIAAHEAAGSEKNGGLLEQVGGTAGMAALSRKGVRMVREIDAVLTARLRRSTELLAAWKSASHVERAPRRSKQTSGPAAAPALEHPEREPALPATESRADTSGGSTGSSGRGAGGSPLAEEAAVRAWVEPPAAAFYRDVLRPERFDGWRAFPERGRVRFPGCTYQSLPLSSSHRLL